MSWVKKNFHRVKESIRLIPKVLHLFLFNVFHVEYLDTWENFINVCMGN